MAFNLNNIKSKVKSEKRISNIYENTTFVIPSVSKKLEDEELQENYDEVDVSTCTREKFTPKKAQPNQYTTWDDRKVGPGMIEK